MHSGFLSATSRLSPSLEPMQNCETRCCRKGFPESGPARILPGCHPPPFLLQSPRFGMNIPTKLTLAGLVLTAIFLVVFFNPFRFGDTVALCIFSIASLTDYFDGKIARRDNLITNFGILMDPLADKIL